MQYITSYCFNLRSYSLRLDMSPGWQSRQNQTQAGSSPARVLFLKPLVCNVEEIIFTITVHWYFSKEEPILHKHISLFFLKTTLLIPSFLLKAEYIYIKDFILRVILQNIVAFASENRNKLLLVHHEECFPAVTEL